MPTAAIDPPGITWLRVSPKYVTVRLVEWAVGTDLVFKPVYSRFAARLLVPGPRRLTELSGRWMVGGGLSLAAVVIPAPAPGQG